jgi:hypothetical protein
VARRPRLMTLTWSVLLTVLLAAACGGAPAASPVQPTTTSPPASLPIAATPSAVVTPLSARTPPTVGSAAHGTATVSLGGETYELLTGEPPVCSMDFGIQAGMSSADRRASLDLYTAGSTVGSFTFARVLDGELWQPAGDPPPFEVSRPHATWTGTMRERNSGREEQVTIDISCGD